MSNGNLYGFLDQVINLVKGNSVFRDRLGTYHDSGEFVDPGNVTETEALKFIWGDDNAYVYALGDASHAARQKAISLLPFAEIRLEQHTVSRPGGSCGENFTQLDSQWMVTFSDHARSAAEADITADHLASQKDHYLWVSQMLTEFEADNANQDFHFDSIDLSTIKRTAPGRRGEVVDFWFSEFTFTVNSGS